jgi:hypothetical protein
VRTSLYSILCIGIRLAALLLAVNVLLSVPAGYASLAHGEWGRNEIGWLAAVWFVVLLFALLLWVYPGALARIAAGKASQQIFESPIPAEELQYIAFSIVGLWIFLGGLIGFAEMGLRELFVDHVLRNNHAGLDSELLKARAITDFATYILRIAAGGILMLRANGLVGLLRRTREAGLPPMIEQEPAGDDKKS